MKIKLKYIVSLLILFIYQCTTAQSSRFTSIYIDKFLQIANVFSIDIENNFYIIDSDNNYLIKINSNGELLKEIGGYGWGQLEFDNPIAIEVSNGLNVFVSDYYNHRIQRFNKDLEYIGTLSTRDKKEANEKFGYPSVIAVDKFSNLFVYDGENKRIMKFDSKSNLVKIFGGYQDYEGKLIQPIKMEIAANDDVYILDNWGLYVYDNWGKLLRKIDYNDQDVNISFTVDKRIYLLNQDEMHVYDLNGDRLNIIKIGEIFDNKEEEKIKDIKVNKGIIYLLTSKRIISCPKNNLEY